MRKCLSTSSSSDKSSPILSCAMIFCCPMINALIQCLILITTCQKLGQYKCWLHCQICHCQSIICHWHCQMSRTNNIFLKRSPMFMIMKKRNAFYQYNSQSTSHSVIIKTGKVLLRTKIMKHRGIFMEIMCN